MLLHASPPTAATRSLSQTGLCAPGTASLPIRSLCLPAGDPKATGQLQEVPWDHRPLDCTLDSMRNDRVLQPPIGGQDQRRQPPARSGQSPSALIEAKLNPLRQTHGKTPTELPCALRQGSVPFGIAQHPGRRDAALDQAGIAGFVWHQTIVVVVSVVQPRELQLL